MAGQIYYVDPQHGDNRNTGLSMAQPIASVNGRTFQPGDSILFKSGSVTRGVLDTCCGSDKGVITYGAYGEGERPLFLGSESAHGAEKWVEESASIWRYTGTFSGEVCNIVFDGGESWGHLRWEREDLKKPGDWHYTKIGTMAAGEEAGRTGTAGEGVLYLVCDGNPGEVYRSIECVMWGQRRLTGGRSYITFEGLAFRNSGVHGYQDCRVDHITIRDCEFRFIGGAVWSRPRRIRFGNAVEFWDGAVDCVVERCIFKDIYDSGVTHQGSDTSDVPTNVRFQNNLFVRNGLGAYEWRGPASADVYFENNTCVDAGGGYCLQGETLPRQWEESPAPIGDHVFIWRLDRPDQMGKAYIRNNIFSQAPWSGAVHSVIKPEYERQWFVLDGNAYWQTTSDRLIKMNGRVYTTSEFDRYRRECNVEANGFVADPRFVDAANGDYRLRPDSPCKTIGADWLRE